MSLPDFFQKAILEKVHHSQEGVESLVGVCSELLESQYFLHERIKLHVPKLNKEFCGVITTVDKTSLATPKQKGSPNSDKENDIKMKPYSYTVSVLFNNVEKPIKSVPTGDIVRTAEVPSQEEIRDFLSTSASRRADKAYWIVKDSLREKFKISDKYASIFASPGTSKPSPISSEKKSAKSLINSLSCDSKKSTPSSSASKKESKESKEINLAFSTSSSDSDSEESKKKASASTPTPLRTQKARKSLPSPAKKSESSTSDLPKKKESDSDGPPKLEKELSNKTTSLSSGSESESSSSSDEEETEAAPIRRSLGLPPTGKAAGKVLKAKEKEREQEKKWKLKEKERMKKEREKQKKERERLKKKIEMDEEKARQRMDAFLKKMSSASSTVTVDLTESDDESSKPAAIATPAHVLNAAKRKNALKVLSGSVQKRKSLDGLGKKKKPPILKKAISASAKLPGEKKKKSIFDGLDSASSDDDLPLSQTLKTPTKLNKIIKPPTPKTKPLTPSQLLQMRSAATITQLERALKLGLKSKRFQTEVTIAARILNASYLESINDPVIREAVRERQEKYKEEEMLKKMTEEEKKEYLEKKRDIQRRKTKEKKRLAALESRRRFEETELPDLKALPEAEAVSTPESVPNECFGDVAMVTEFFTSYSDFLNVKESKMSSYELMGALDAGKDGFHYVSQILVPLLQTLLQDEVAKDYKYLNVELMKMDVNAHNAGELVRLCLRPRDQDSLDSDHSDKEDSDHEDDSFQAEHVESGILTELEYKEFFELEPSHQLKLLVALIHRLLDSYGVNDFQDTSQRDSTALWKERMQILQEKNQEKEAEKAKIKEKAAKTLTTPILEPFGVKPEEKRKEEEKKDCDTPGASGDEDGGGEGTKKSRRETRAQREEQERKDREKRREEMELIHKIQNREANEKRIEAGMKAAKRVQRLNSLGSDRNHDRYWIFSKYTPGLFIEKGWVTQHIDYHAEAPVGQDLTAKSEQLDLSEANKSNMSGRLTPAIETDETTVPRAGQNLWFELKGAEKLEELLSSLHPKGARESHLREQISHMSEKISQILNATSSSVELKREDSKAGMISALKEDILDTEARVRSGGLGGVEDFSLWSATLHSASDPQAVAECLLLSQENVKEKFLKGIMKSEKGNTELDPEKEGTPRTCKGVERWREGVREAGTYSRLHILHQIFLDCVEWGKSLDYVKCKICKRKGFDDQLLLCDSCDVGYHMFCLRPRVKRIPQGDWLCPSCKLKHAPRRNRYNTEEDSGESEGESGDERKGGKKKGAGKKGDKRKRAVFTPELSSDEESKPNRKAKVKAQAAIRECEVQVSRVEESKDGNEGREMTTLQQTCEEIVKKLAGTRLTASLTTLPKNVQGATTRAGRGKKEKHREIDLSNVRTRLDLYVDLEELFTDLKDVIKHGLRVYEGQQRKVDQLEELSGVLESLEATYLGEVEEMQE